MPSWGTLPGQNYCFSCPARDPPCSQKFVLKEAAPLSSWLPFTYSQFSFLVGVTFYEVSINTELPMLNHCSQGKYQVRCLQATGHNIFMINSSINSSDQFITLFSLFPLKDTLFNIFCWLVNIELMADSTVTHVWRKLIKHKKACLFSAHNQFLARRNTRRCFSTVTGCHFKQQNHQPKVPPQMWY